MRARALALAAIAALCSAAGFAPNVFAQQADEPLLATASEWGGQGGVYTCAQWRAYVTRMYRLGEPRKRGYFEAICAADTVIADGTGKGPIFGNLAVPINFNQHVDIADPAGAVRTIILFSV